MRQLSFVDQFTCIFSVTCYCLCVCLGRNGSLRSQRLESSSRGRIEILDWPLLAPLPFVNQSRFPHPLLLTNAPRVNPMHLRRGGHGSGQDRFASVAALSLPANRYPSLISHGSFRVVAYRRPRIRAGGIPTGRTSTASGHRFRRVFPKRNCNTRPRLAVPIHCSLPSRISESLLPDSSYFAM